MVFYNNNLCDQGGDMLQFYLKVPEQVVYDLDANYWINIFLDSIQNQKYDLLVSEWF